MTRSWEEIPDANAAHGYNLRNALYASRADRAAARAFELGVRDAEINGWVERLAQKHVQSISSGKAIPFRPSLPGQLHVRVGCDAIRGFPVGLAAADLRRHGLLLGATGAGKTILATVLLLSAICQRLITGIWIFDSYKLEMRWLIEPMCRAGRRCAVITPSSTPFNLLHVPAGQQPLAHAAVVCDALAASLHLPEGAARLLHQQVHNLYLRWEEMGRNPGLTPTLYDLFESLRTSLVGHLASREALLDRLRELLSFLTPKAAAWRVGWMPAELARRNVIWELAGSAECVKSYLLDAMVNGALRDQLRKPAPALWPNTVMFIDDAQRLISADATRGRMSPLAETLLVGRSAGVSILAGHQSVEGVDRLLLSQLGTRFIGRLGLAADWRWAQEELGLTHEQVEWCLHHLTAGLFVMQSSTGESGDRFPHLIRVPMATPLPVDEATVTASRAALSDLPLVPASEFARWEPWPVSVVPPPPAPARAASSPLFELADAEERFLRAVVNEPGLASSKYIRKAAVSPQRAAVIRKRLVALGLIREQTLSMSATGRPAVVLEATELGHRIARDGSRSEP